MLYKEIISKEGWNLDNSYTKLPKLFFSKVNPDHAPSPKLVVFNYSLAKSLGLNGEVLKNNIDVLCGNKIPKGSVPIAQAYAGHQFGYFTMLGDGRAALLGEQITPKGDKVDVQLKGSGITPYSRGGDGKAALGPMLREYIISEAMKGLNVPTTGSLAVLTTGESIMREKEQQGAILVRTASSHIRVGTFQYASKWGTIDELKALADYTLKRHFPNYINESNPYIFLLNEVIKRQAHLISKWQLVGFIHGVMNTDNMAISGETIDYGPCAFMDIYDPKTVFSSIDIKGRYAYENQVKIAKWNLKKFSQTLLPLLHSEYDKALEIANDSIEQFDKIYHENWILGMRKKLGIFNEESEDENLIKELLHIMYKYKADYTNTFIHLTFNNMNNLAIFNSEEFIKWNEAWQSRLNRQKQCKDSSHKLMKDNNPALIPRNHRVEEALEAATKYKDYSVMEKFLSVLSNPYAHTSRQLEYSTLPEKADCPYQTFCGT